MSVLGDIVRGLAEGGEAGLQAYLDISELRRRQAQEERLAADAEARRLALEAERAEDAAERRRIREDQERLARQIMADDRYQDVDMDTALSAVRQGATRMLLKPEPEEVDDRELPVTAVQIGQLREILGPDADLEEIDTRGEFLDALDAATRAANINLSRRTQSRLERAEGRRDEPSPEEEIDMALERAFFRLQDPRTRFQSNPEAVAQQAQQFASGTLRPLIDQHGRELVESRIARQLRGQDIGVVPMVARTGLEIAVQPPEGPRSRFRTEDTERGGRRVIRQRGNQADTLTIGGAIPDVSPFGWFLDPEGAREAASPANALDRFLRLPNPVQIRR